MGSVGLLHELFGINKSVPNYVSDKKIGDIYATSYPYLIPANEDFIGQYSVNRTFFVVDDHQNSYNETEDCSSGYNSHDTILSSSYFQTMVYFLYISILLTALIGNGIVCFIVQSSPRMKTVTNYFLFNLALGDILMSVFCVPFSFVPTILLQFWPFGTVLCHLVNYSQAISVLVSAYTLVAISVDRYIVIMWPLRPRITKRYAKCIIAVVWVIALVTAFPIIIVSKLYQPEGWHQKCDKYICHEDWSEDSQYFYYTLALMTLQFVIPIVVLCFTYIRIAIAVWGKRPPGEAENSRDQKMARSKRKMIKMMVTVVIVFTVCWLPFNILGLLLYDVELQSWKLLPYFWFGCHWLAMAHSCCNPIIYCYMNERFRLGFMKVLHDIPIVRRCWCVRQCARGRGGSIGAGGLALTGIDETSQLHRVNTCTTYISSRRKAVGKTPILPTPCSCAETTLLR
ncbi:RYamide receptor isoform X3 [Phlebotomus papatasi]|uniref:RYamide receptor isoform X3 n=1 Tax=Phlebotomus papatasi TaxID=29031 RepID=UPI002483A028|nr:RYamide receptor isoform X3 [Phlebotomus papatasi]XP_055697935.1 RYamide receptor isoform X3 [Phlebotomus papatasi]